jgi:hypothetical protein
MLAFGRGFPNQTSRKGVNRSTPNASRIHLVTQISGRFSPMVNCENIARMLNVAEMTGLKITPIMIISRIEIIFSSANEKLSLLRIKYDGKKAASEFPRAIKIEKPTGSPFDKATKNEPIIIPGSASKPNNRMKAIASPICGEIRWIRFKPDNRNCKKRIASKKTAATRVVLPVY